MRTDLGGAGEGRVNIYGKSITGIECIENELGARDDSGARKRHVHQIRRGVRHALGGAGRADASVLAREWQQRLLLADLGLLEAKTMHR